MVELMALEGARSLAAGLSELAATQPSAELLLYGAYVAGACFASVGSGLHHRICHALGGAFDLPHAKTHAVMLPHVLAFNAPALPTVMAKLAIAFGVEDPVTGLRDLCGRCHAPQSLAEIGLAGTDLPRAIELVTAKLPIDNPRFVGAGDIATLLTAAYHGEAGS
jgi:alcohol dehydrogenase class IV